MQRLEAIDLRTVFRTYAIVAGVGGLVIFGWGPMWFGVHLAEQPFGRAALVRVWGSILIAAGCGAVGLASADDRQALRRAMFWFASGHLVVFLGMASQQLAVWDSPLVHRLLNAYLGVTCLLFYLARTSEGDRGAFKMQTLFGGSEQPSAALRSQYEQQIRQAARQEERNRLARDLHDSIKQQIFVIQTAAATAQARFDTDAPGARQALDQVRDSARESMTEMQAMLDQMAAAPLENSGLVEALRKLCEAFGFRTGAKVEFKPGSLPDSEALPPGAHEALLRVAQEALANAGRHARASHVAVSLGIAAGSVRLGVEDDGAGFDPAAAPRGQGLANMRARAEEFGGSFELATHAGGGTSIAVSIPYQAASPSSDYRRDAIINAAAVALLVALTLWERSLGFLFITGVAAIGAARYFAAWRRAVARERHAR
jgi:signal transduction histidine kinase